MSKPPADGPVYDPENKDYWEPRALQKEVHRTFEICQGCRQCYDHCDVFPRLFHLVDAMDSGETSVSARQTHRVVNSCFQCKLCEVQCPYTAGAGHELDINFPKMVLRYQAQQFEKQNQATTRERVLGDLYTSRKKMRSALSLTRYFKKLPPFRWFLDTFYGLSSKKQWPVFSKKTFSEIAAGEGKIKSPSPDLETVFFQSCTMDTIDTQIGRDALAVLEANGVVNACVQGLGCCGMPDANDGNLVAFRAKAKHNIELLLPYVEVGVKILVANPSCALMMKREYLELLESPWRDKAQRIAAATTGVTDFIWKRRTQSNFAELKSAPPTESVAYHISCHQRAQGPSVKGRDLVRKVGGVRVTPIMTCCGQGGGHAFKSEFYQTAKEKGDLATQAMAESGESLWITECPLAPLQFGKLGQGKCMHPLTFLANCYRNNGFQDSEVAVKPQG